MGALAIFLLLLNLLCLGYTLRRSSLDDLIELTILAQLLTLCKLFFFVVCCWASLYVFTTVELVLFLIPRMRLLSVVVWLLARLEYLGFELLFFID